MNSKNFALFDASMQGVRSDCCAEETKDVQNNAILDYELYQYLPVKCDNEHARYPEFAYEHVNLHGRVGYGISDGCVVDNYSKLRTDPAVLTRDRCRIQLFSRIFQGCPNLAGGIADSDAEMPILQGLGTRDLDGVSYVCKKAITEMQTNKPMPLLDCTKEVQNPVHIVEEWIRGGDATRDYVRRQEFLKECGKTTFRKEGLRKLH